MRDSSRPRGLWSISWPIYIEELSGGLVFLADAYFLSLISDEVAASIGILVPVLLLGYFIIPMFSSAGTSVASQYMGAKQDQWVIPTYMANILLSSFLGLVLAILCTAFSQSIGLWLGMSDQMNTLASTYLSILGINFFLIGVRFSYASITASKGLTRWNMATSLITDVLNVFLNATFFFGWFGLPAMGLTGIALATVISFFVGTCSLVLLVHFPLGMRFQWQDIGHKITHVLRPIIKIGLPSAAEPLSYALQQIVISMVVIKLGLIAMGANTYLLRILILEITFSFALSTGGQILMAHYMGADKFDDINRVFWKCLRLSCLFALVNVAICVVFAEQLFGLFTNNPDIINLGYWMLVISLVTEPARAINIAAGLALKGVGDARFSATVGIALMWAVVPLMFMAGIEWGYGMLGVWICFTLDECLRAGINLWRWQTGIWKTKGIKDPANEELVSQT